MSAKTDFLDEELGCALKFTINNYKVILLVMRGSIYANLSM